MSRNAWVLLLSTLAIVAFGSAAVAVDGATLYTTGARTTTVPPGATASLVATGGIGLSGLPCAGSTLSLTLQQNSAGTVRGAVTGGTFTGCVTGGVNGTFPWTLTIGGTGQRYGTTGAWPEATLSNVAIDFLLARFAGTLNSAVGGAPPTAGVWASQGTAAGAPVCVNLTYAGSLFGGAPDPLDVDGQYCFEGHPAGTWSLEAGDPTSVEAPTTATLRPVTLYTSAARTAGVAVGATTTLASTGSVSFTRGTAALTSCGASTLTLVVTQNATGAVRGTVTNGSFSGCGRPTQGTFPWALTAGGTGIGSSFATVEVPQVTATGVAITQADGLGNGLTYTGTLTDAWTGTPAINGLSLRWSTATGLCVVLDHAGALNSNVSNTHNVRLTGTYCAESHPGTTWALPFVVP